MTRLEKTICLLTCLLLTACFKENFEKDGLLLRVDAESVIVPADVEDMLPIEKSITVSSNRSWSAFLSPEVDWVKLSVTEFENIARSEENTVINLNFENNQDRSTSRETMLCISTADGQLKIPVAQNKQVPYIRLVSSPQVTDIVCQEDTSVVSFVSNTSWTATIMEGATAKVSLDKSAGAYSDEIKVYFKENEETDIEPEAVLLLKDALNDLAEPVMVYFKQGKSQPYVKWDTDFATYSSSEEGQLTVTFRTNSSWSASLKEPVEGITLGTTQGDKSQKSITVDFDEYYGVGQTRSAVVQLSVSGEEVAEMTVSQVANQLYLDFTGGNQPFTTKIPSVDKAWKVEQVWISDTPTEYLLKCNGGEYDFVFYSGQGFGLVALPDGQTCGIAWAYSKRDIGTGAWIKLPAVAGKTLKTVKMYMSNMGSTAQKRYVVAPTQPTTTAVPSGVNILGQASAAGGNYAKVDLNNPQPGVSYYLIAANTSLYFSKLHLYYE